MTSFLKLTANQVLLSFGSLAHVWLTWIVRKAVNAARIKSQPNYNFFFCANVFCATLFCVYGDY